MAKLALRGGSKVFSEPLAPQWPIIDQTDERALLKVFRSGQWWRGGTIEAQAASECGNFPGENGQVHYAEGIFVGYRHYETREILPLFPFGYGLSYTTFEYDHLQFAPAQIGPADSFQVSVQVRNTGDLPGKEVVQLYVGDLESSLERPVKELKAFAKIDLDSGEERTVRFDLGPDALSFYDPAQSQWIVEPGSFEISVGGNSQSVLRQPLIVK